MPESDKVTKKLVLIDDDTISHFIFKAILKKKRPDVLIECFENAFSALKKIQDNELDATAIVLDINMPKMTGWEFLEELKKLDKVIPVYMLTSSNDKRDRLKMLEFDNVRDYFVKPLEGSYLDEMMITHFKKT